MSIIIDSEEIFKIQLLEDIGERYMVFKSNHKYSVVDFICINKNNLRNFHIEHKKRSGEKCDFDTLYIGFDKVNKVNEYFKDTYYIWDFDNVFYWVKHNEDFLNRNTGYSNGSKVYHILVSEVKTGYSNFIELINSFSNNRY
jgi:hypothetical protein